MSEALKNQRTYALVGSGGCGKTSVAEMLLFATKKINRLGKIEEGSTVLDYEPEEVKRRGSTQPGFACYQWNKNTHFLIDAPGASNFCGDLSYILTAADSAIFVIDAVDGVKPLAKKAWNQVKKAGLPAMIFVNKMDRDRADFDMAMSGISEILGARPVLLYMPIGQRENFKGVVDILADKALIFDDMGSATPGDVPGDMADEVAAMRETMIENVAESDEALMEKYLEEGELTLDEINQALSAGVTSGELVPVCVGSALQNMGAALILDTIQKLLPSPLEHAPWQGKEGSERASSPDEPLAAFVFKTQADPFAGQLTVARVLSGTMEPDSTLLNPAKGDKERVGQPLLMTGKETIPSKEPLGPGAIVTLGKLKHTQTGDTLCDEKHPFELEQPETAPQLITFALAPQEKGDEDKVYQAVPSSWTRTSPSSWPATRRPATCCSRAWGRTTSRPRWKRPSAATRWTSSSRPPRSPTGRPSSPRPAEIQGRHKKQTGGRGQFGDCWIHMEPQPKGEGYEFVDAIVGGVIPRQYIPAVDKGIQEASARGVLAGYPLIDFKVTLYDGSYHNVDSSEMAFKIAGSLAFKKACEKAGVKLLEPIAEITVDVPDEFMGDIIGDLSSRRGKVLGSEATAGTTSIKAHVPMSEILKYSPDLSSMTGGQGSFSMEFSHYEEAPPPVVDKVVAESKQEEE